MKQSYQSILRPLQSHLGLSTRSPEPQVAARRFQSQFASTRPPTVASTLRRSSRPFAPVHTCRRHQSDLAVSGEESKAPKDLQPAYQLSFTCKPCKTRSAHRVTKQGYHHGTTLITCPGCKSRHLISDHLKIFSDQRVTLEDILQKKLEGGRPLADLLKKGKLGIRQGAIVGNEGEEDLEFWEDGTETVHEKAP